MRSLVLILILSAFNTLVNAQVDEPYQKDEDDKIIININQDTWQSTPAGIKLRPVSIGFDFANYYDLKFGKSNFSLGIGWGISSHNVHHNGQFVDSLKNNNRYTYLLPRNKPSEKNKLVVNYIDFPLELRFKTKTKRTFRLMIGAKAGWHISNHTKTIDEDGKRKLYGIEGIRRYHYGITGRIGYGDINFTVFYGMTSIFEDNAGPTLNPLSIGFSIIPF